MKDGTKNTAIGIRVTPELFSAVHAKSDAIGMSVTDTLRVLMIAFVRGDIELGVKVVGK